MWGHGHRPLDELVKIIEEAKAMVPIGSIRAHHKNSSNYYKVVDIVTYEADDELLVIYESVTSQGKGPRFARKVSIFLEKVLREGKLQERFTRL